MGGKKVVHVKKVPLRQCTGCNERREKKELIRIIRTPEEEIVVDFTGKKNGRGAYICKSENCLNKLKKTKKLEKVFEINISDEFYESLRGVIVE